MSTVFNKLIGNSGFFALTLGKSQQSEIENLPFRTITVESKGTVSRAREILRIAESHGVECIYCREEILAIVIIFLIKINKKTIRLFFEHHWIGKNLRITFSQFILARVADGHVFVTESLKSRFFKRYFINRDQQVLVAHDAVNLDFFLKAPLKLEARSKLEINEEDFVLMYSGRFTTMGVGKGIDAVLSAVAFLSQKNILFLAIGAASQEEAQKFELEAKRNKVRARFIPYLPQEQLREHLAAADAFVMPFPDTPHYRFDMSPLKLFEYMAMNRPIIATDLDSIKEVLDTDSAFFFEPGNIQSLSETISYVAENTMMANDKAHRAFILAGSYTWEKRANDILSYMIHKY
jgi:glycosyltransferase involved in cell wall biosynthesis